jgi:O-antigen ligase
MNNYKDQLHNRIHFILLALIAFTMTFSVKVTSLLIGLCLLHWFIEGGLLNKVRRTLRDRISLLFILLFVMHLLSILVSENRTEAFAIVERKLSLLIFPFMLCKTISAKQIRKIALVFSAAVTTGLLICYLNAFIQYFQTPDTGVFYYHQFSSAIGIHAVYLEAYAVFSIHLLWCFLVIELPQFRRIAIIIIIFLVVSCFLLSSKMMMFVLLAGAMTTLFQTELISLKKKTIIGLSILIVFSSGILLLPNLKHRFDLELATQWQTVGLNELPHDAQLTGTSFRLIVWKLSIDILHKQNAWLSGVGIGDFQNLLNRRYSEAGMYMGYPASKDHGYKNYNPHNQYIELLLSIGVIGLLLFILLIYNLFGRAIRNKNLLLIQLSLILMLFSLTESVLSTNKGIIFFLFFICLLNQDAFIRKLSP